MSMKPEDFPIPCEERLLRYPEAAADPVGLLRGALSQQAKGHRNETDRMLSTVALAQFQLGRVASEIAAGSHESASEMLGLIAENLRDLLSQYAVRADDQIGREWVPEMRTTADVRGYRVQAELAAPRVAYTEAPPIYRKDRLLAKGAVSIEGPPRGNAAGGAK